MTPCPRKGKWIRGCRFEARFDFVEKAVEPDTFKGGDEAYRILRDSLRARRTYVHDICTRCGEIKKREQP